MVQAVQTVIEALIELYGADWLADDDANARFAAEAQLVLADVEGAHMIGEPEFDEGRILITIWVDEPLEDMLSTDQLAFDLFSRISEELFFTERIIKQRTVDYPFVTGSSRHGHAGSLILSGPHAADFAQRFQVRTTGGTRFHA